MTSCSAIDVGVDLAQHFGDARRHDPAIHAAAAVDVVGGDADVDGALAAARVGCCGSLLPLQDPDERTDDLLPQRPRAPLRQRDLVAVARGRARSPRAAAPATPRSHIATLTSSLCSNDRLSMFVVPSTAHSPSTISTLACIIVSRYSKMRMPASSSCPHMRRLASAPSADRSPAPGRMTVTSTPRLRDVRPARAAALDRAGSTAC